MQQPTNVRLVSAGLLGCTSVLFALYGNSPSFTTTKTMLTQRAFTIANQYHLVHAIAVAVLAVAAPNLKSLPGRVACDLRQANLCFTVGALVMALPQYLQCTVCEKQRWLSKVSRVGSAILALGWGFVVAAAVRSGAKA